MTDPHGRPLLPQSHNVSKPAHAPAEHREGQKNFVFVNEHDRQKRLKVMRACEACRKRKIKCDAVSTNIWPCSKCQRSGLECVPPTTDGNLQGDGDFYSDSTHEDTKPVNVSSSNTVGAPLVWASQPQPTQPQAIPQANPSSSASSTYPFSSMPAHATLATPPQLSLSQSFTESYEVPPPDFSSYQPFDSSHAESSTITSSTGADGSWRGQSPEEELSGALGDLQINQDAIAPYMVNSRALAEGPAIQEAEIELPKTIIQGSTVRIPDEMMPAEELATKYFDYYFTNVHPYIPVLNRNYFRIQWAQDRESISPLILEGIFACATQMLHRPKERAQWGALAARHEDSFKDVPRLSTLQGMLILLKSKEAVPKRGYYYRSWMSIVNMVAMAKDLRLHEHFEMHQLGRGCDPTDGDCSIKTRIWHTLFQLEIMVGGPQGRFEFSVHPDTVDFQAPRTPQNLDSAELKIFQDHTQLVKIAANIRGSNQLFAKLRKQKANWAADPDFVAHAAAHDRWPETLPPHLRITYPDDGSAPWIPFHVIGNFHSYHWLGVLMHHRPMLANASDEANVSWKQEQMRICYDSATKLCRLQEAIVTRFGMEGLMCMMRGINFTIYCVLTCTMIHLVAITSPDPALNDSAANYFTRHMRILEKCVDAWPMEEVRRQIDSLRQAFSADLSKPFELKANFPYGSPGRSADTPNSEDSYPSDFNQKDLRGNAPFDPNTVTPPASSGHPTAGSDFGAAPSQSFTVPFGSDLAAAQANMQAQWNPSRIFDQWSIAFSPPPASQSTPSASAQTPQSIQMTNMYNQSPPQAQSHPPQDHWAPAYQTQGGNLSTSPLAVQHLQPQQHVSYGQPAAPTQPQQLVQPMYDGMPTFITPTMWQEAVIDSYPDGLKRRGGTSISGPSGKRAR